MYQQHSGTKVIDCIAYVLENRFPLFPGADGIRAPHHQAFGGDTQVLAIARLEGQPAKEITQQNTVRPAGSVKQTKKAPESTK